MHPSETRIFIGFLSFLGNNYLPRFLLENRIQQHPALRNHPATSQARRGAILRTFPTETFGTDFTMSTSVGSAMGHQFPTWKLDVWSKMYIVYQKKKREKNSLQPKVEWKKSGNHGITLGETDSYKLSLKHAKNISQMGYGSQILFLLQFTNRQQPKTIGQVILHIFHIVLAGSPISILSL